MLKEIFTNVPKYSILHKERKKKQTKCNTPDQVHNTADQVVDMPTVTCGTHLKFNVMKMLKKISSALLTPVKCYFKNAEALLSLLGLCSKYEKLLIFLSS